MRLEYDPLGDIAYVSMGLPPEVTVSRTVRVGASDEYQRGIDFTVENRIVGYEFMHASQGLDLSDLSDRDRIAAFIGSVTDPRVIQQAS